MRQWIALIPAAFIAFSALPSMAQIPEPKTRDPRIEHNIHKPHPGEVKLDEKEDKEEGKPAPDVKPGPDMKPVPAHDVKPGPGSDVKPGQAPERKPGHELDKKPGPDVKPGHRHEVNADFGKRPIIDPNRPPKPRPEGNNVPHKVRDPKLHKPVAGKHPAKHHSEKCRGEFEACVKSNPDKDHCVAQLKKCDQTE